MTVDTLLMLAGTFVALLPFLGFPQSWDKMIFLFLGILVVALGIVVRRRGNRPQVEERNERAFSERMPAMSERVEQASTPASPHEELAQ